jgi:negative regulator of sigma E activity
MCICHSNVTSVTAAVIVGVVSYSQKRRSSNCHSSVTNLTSAFGFATASQRPLRALRPQALRAAVTVL